MKSLASRPFAVLAAVAHWLGYVAGSLAWFAPRHWPWGLVPAVLLAVGGWQSHAAARGLEAARARPEPVPLAAVVDGVATGWAGTSSVVRGPFLDSSAYGADVLRFYYVLLDPQDDDIAMIARSVERLEERRTRTIVARVTRDPQAVAAAAADLDPAGQARVDAERYLVEQPDRPGELVGPSVVTTTTLGSSPAGRITFRGDFVRARPAADGDGWEYLAVDGGRSVVVRSTHPPDRLPVDVWGVAVTDPVRVEQSLAVPELRSAVAGRDLPSRRLIAEGASPPIPEVSYVPAMVMAALAALLATGWALGYPIYRRREMRTSLVAWPVRPGEEVGLELFGVDARGPRRIPFERVPGRIERLDPDELERRSWQFGLRDAPPERAAPPRMAAGGASRLVLTSGEGPLLVELEPPPAGLELGAGDLVFVSGSRPALRIRLAGLDLLASFRSDADRERALAAIRPDLRSGIPAGQPPAPSPVRHPVPRGLGTPPALRAASVVLAVVAVVMLVAGLAGLGAAALEPAAVPPAAAQILVGLGVALVSRAVWQAREWARSVAFTLGWVGAAVAAFLVVAAPQCGLWLAPNLGACRAAGPVGSVAAALAAIGLAYVALAVSRHPGAFTR